ncbi:MAG: hypothetical protein WCF18_09005 [Chthoniobacteraceae bacterium]
MPIPAAPADFAVAHVGIDNPANKPAVRFTFTNNEAGATHLIQTSSNGTTGWKDLVEAASGKAFVDAHGFALSAKFQFRIRAEFAAQGTFSDWVLISGNPLITLPKLPTAVVQINAPSNLVVAQNDFRGIKLTWTDNANNESLHLLRLSGPGLPAGGLEIGINHLDGGAYTIPLNFPFAGGYVLQNAKTYTASVRVRGGKQTTAATTLTTDSTADVSFTTAAAHVALTNLPGTVSVSRGEAFSFRIFANSASAAFSVVAGALPAGLSLTGDTISGTTTAAIGSYAVSIKADDGATDDTQVLTLNLVTPAFVFTNLPANPTAWNTVPFLFRAATNTPAVSITLTGTLPNGLSFDGVDSVSGTPNEGDAGYPVTLHSSNPLSTAAGTLTINVRTPSILVLLKPHGGAVAPKSGEDWGEVVAPLGQAFAWDISAQPVGPISVGSGITITNAPAWLTLNGAQISGTADVSETSDVTIEWSNGTFTGSTVLRIRVPTIQITSADNFAVYEDQDFSFPLTSLPAGIFSFSDPEEAPAGVTVRALPNGSYVLAGKSSAVGTHGFELLAKAGMETDKQIFTLTVQPVITLGDEDEIAGWQGEPVLGVLSYLGPCSVAQWFLVNAPPGVEIAELSCPGPYEETKQIVAISGKPTASGKWDATAVAQVCCGGMPKLHRRPVVFSIAGGLYVPWLHADRTLYDLQFDVRGTLSNRGVRSYYARAGVRGDNATVTTKETAENSETTTTRTVATAEKPPEILMLKRGDKVRLAILPRDGRDVLAEGDGVTNVALAMRLDDSPDREYLFSLDAAQATLDGRYYFGADLAVSSAFLDELMGDDGVLNEPVQIIAEIRCKLDGFALSSDSFFIQIAEDVHEE